MGHTASAPSTLTPQELALISASSHYTEAEIAQLHAQVLSDCPSGFIPFTTFLAFAASQGVIDEEAVAVIFRGFDADRDGIITFAELCKGLSAITRGTNEEKIRFAFRMHDTENTGSISRHRLLSNISSLHRAFVAHHAAQDFNPHDVVKLVFGDFPGDFMTFADFATLASSNPDFVHGLALTVK